MVDTQRKFSNVSILSEAESNQVSRMYLKEIFQRPRRTGNRWLISPTVGHQKVGCILAAVMDLHLRCLIGWSMSTRINRQIVTDALKMALWRRKFPKGVIVHTGQRSQYGSTAYGKLIN